jgi:hypothetical protein
LNLLAEPKLSSKKAAPRSEKFPMRQTRALPACVTAKSLENQLSAFSHQLSAFSF